MNRDSNLYEGPTPDQMPGFNLEEYKKGREYQNILKDVARINSPEYLEYEAAAREYNMDANRFMESHTSSAPKQVNREEKIRNVINSCKKKSDDIIKNCVKYGYLSLYAGSDGIPVEKVDGYSVWDPNKIIDMFIITKKIKQYQEQIQKEIENGSMLPDLKGHKYNPQGKEDRLIRDQIRTKPTTQTSFKKRSKRVPRKVSANRSKKRSKRHSMKLSQNRSKKRSKRKSDNRSKKRSKRVSAKRSK